MTGSDYDVDKILGSLPITNNTLEAALVKLLGWDNGDMIRLIHGLISESHKGVEMFMRLTIGEHLPPVPPVGAEIYVPINKMSWSVDEKEWTNSPFNENGYVKCSVLSTRAIHNYGPIEVQLPIWEKYPDPIRVRIELTDYKRADVLDFYQSDDQVQPRPTSPF